MTTNKGFKQTEIGTIPEDWKVVKLGEIFNFYPTSNYSKAEMTFSGNIGCMHYGLIHAIPNAHFSLEKGVTYYLYSDKTKYELIKDGDIVMVDASEDLVGVNKSVEVYGVMDNKFIAGLHTYLMRDENLAFANYFRGQILNSSIVKNQMLRLAVGMKVFGVSKPQLKEVLLPLPPLPEQTAIATALSDMDALITQTDRLIQKKKAIKQGLMQELLSPKEGWEVRKLGEVADIYTGKRNNQDKIEDGQYPFFVRSQNVEKINSYSYDGEAILVPGEGNIGKIFHYINGKFDFHQRVYKISDFANFVNGKYIFMYIKENFGQYALSNSVKATVDSLRLPTFLEFKIPIPPIAEQTRIAEILTDADNEIQALASKRAKLHAQKQGMMQVLLTGKIRLNP
jgi:type I restriction enzyme S subunit